MRQVTQGSTNISVDLYIVDDTDGTPETGVLWNTAGIDLEYRREGAAAVNVTEDTLASLTTAHTDGGFLEIGHGYYRFDVPDAAFASGALSVSIQGTVTGMVVLPQTIQLVAFDTQDSTRLGLTALPNANADAAGGLPISDAGGLDLDTQLAATNEVTAARMGALTDWIDGGRLDLLLDDVPTTAEFEARTLVSAGYATPTNITAGTITTATNVTNQVTADMTAISGDSTAADNLEATYDGTGYTDVNAPAKQSQLSSLTNVGSAVHKAASSYVLTTGTQSANLYTDTEALDGVLHQHTDTAGAIELYYEFLIGGGTASSVQVTGYVTGNNDDIDVYGYDWVTAGWKQIGNIQGTASTANSVYSFDLFVDMVGSGADEGKVRVRFFKASGLTSALLAIDQVFVAFSQGVEGYDNGAVWFNSNASNTGTKVNIDGTARNPVSTSAALLSLLTATGLHKVEVTPGSTLTLGGALEGYDVIGNGSVLALGSQDVGGTVFEKFSSVSGIGTSTADAVFFQDCIFATATLPDYVAQQCGFGATVTQAGPGDFTHIDCYSTVAGSGSPTFTRSGAGVATAEYRRFSGGITQSGITGSDTFTIGGELGTVTLNGASGDVQIRGIYKSVTDNRSGSPALNLDGAIQGADVAAILLDTNELQSDDVPTLIAALPTAAEVNAEVVDVLETDTHAEPASAVGATASIKDSVNYIKAMHRNKMTQTATTTLLRNDADTGTISTSTVSDDGSTFTRGKHT